MIRHTSVDVPKGVCYGQTDVPLADTFPQEAEAVRNKLKKYNIDYVFSSPSSRCLELAKFCGYPNAITDTRLMEINFGEWEMKRYDEIDDPRLQLWYDDFLNVSATDGESAIMQRDRLRDFIRSLDYRTNKTIAIFTHGGILIHSLVLFNGLSYQLAYDKNPGYGSVLEFNLTSDFISNNL